MPLLDHPNIKSAHTEMEAIKNGTIEFVVIIETDLQIDALRPEYDRAAVDKLLGAVQEYMSTNDGVQRAIIKTVR